MNYFERHLSTLQRVIDDQFELEVDDRSVGRERDPVDQNRSIEDVDDSE